MKKILAVLTIVLLAPSLAFAAPSEYTFDKAHTQVMFDVSHLGFSHSHGKFLDFDGGFILDMDNPQASSVNVTIKTGSINMDHEKWEAHLKNEDFFNVEKFPEMTFKSTDVKTTGENTADVTGDLTLLGVTKPVTLQVVYNKSGVHPYTKMYISGFSATGTVKRSDFGMTYGVPAIGENVNLNIQVEGIRKGHQQDQKK